MSLRGGSNAFCCVSERGILGPATACVPSSACGHKIERERTELHGVYISAGDVGRSARTKREFKRGSRAPVTIKARYARGFRLVGTLGAALLGLARTHRVQTGKFKRNSLCVQCGNSAEWEIVVTLLAGVRTAQSRLPYAANPYVGLV